MKILIVGCGIVGATLAYELSQDSDLDVQVLESRSSAAQESTGAALGLLMGVISQKVKGRAWQWRQEGLRYYQRLLTESDVISDLSVFHNAQGLLKLLPDPLDLDKWRSLAMLRNSQGWPMEIWSSSQVRAKFPWLQISDETNAVYSAADWQVHPAQMTRALVQAAEHRGVEFNWDTHVLGVSDSSAYSRGDRGVETERGLVGADQIVITAGLGSALLTANSAQPLELMPVLGQAIHYQLAEPPDFHPVITRNDIHVVPLGGGEYWVGATVEFPVGTEVEPNPESLAELQRYSVEFFPALATAEILTTWSGLRPRPVGRPAPVVERLAGYQNVIVATGHYRNGVLLAPATARMVQELLALTF